MLVTVYHGSWVPWASGRLEELRGRLRKMSDPESIRFGRAAAGMCSPEANFGEPPRQVFVDQLSEALLVWPLSLFHAYVAVY